MSVRSTPPTLETILVLIDYLCQFHLENPVAQAPKLRAASDPGTGRQSNPWPLPEMGYKERRVIRIAETQSPMKRPRLIALLGFAIGLAAANSVERTGNPSNKNRFNTPE
jgi:hypothetical protein